MKQIKTLLVAGLATVMAAAVAVGLAACSDNTKDEKTVSYEFTGTYSPSESSGLDPVDFELDLYEDNTLELSPGIMFTLDESNTLVIDGNASGTWSVSGTTITMTINSADQTDGQPTYSRQYTVEQEGGQYTFQMFPNLMGFTSQSVTMSTGTPSAEVPDDGEDETPDDGEDEKPSVSVTDTFKYTNSSGSMTGEIALNSDNTAVGKYIMAAMNYTLYTANGTWTEDGGVYTINFPADSDNEAVTLTSVKVGEDTAVVWSFKYTQSNGANVANNVIFFLGDALKPAYGSLTGTQSNVDFSLNLYEGGVAVFAPGLILTQDADKNIVTDGVAVGTWKLSEDGKRIELSLTSAGEVEGEKYTVSATLTVEGSGEDIVVSGKINPNLMGFTSLGIDMTNGD